jgi:hypothetical protein
MDYIRWIRERVGQERVFLNFAGGCVENDCGEILLQKEKIKKNGVFQEELWKLRIGRRNSY